MKTIFTALLLVLVTTISLAQITFENGYFIDNNLKRTECLIKNTGWAYNPDEFDYKTSENGEVSTGNPDNIHEFGITGVSKFVKADVKIDVSSLAIDKFSIDRNPEWSEQRLFLKVLVEGKATLYSYSSKNLSRYFYSVGDSSIKQLVYKEYYSDADHIAFNRKFREQLWVDMRCENAKMEDFVKMDFRQNELVKYVRKFNECNGIPGSEYGEKEKRHNLHLRLTPGVTLSDVSVADDFYVIYDTKFENRLGFRIGMEGEYNLPVNKYKWGILCEPVFQHLTAEQRTGTATAEINLNTIEIAAGFRHHFFLSNDLNLFADALYVTGYSLDFNSAITYDYPFAAPLKIQSRYSFAFGGGAGYKKLSAEIRYFIERDMLKNYYWRSRCSSFSVVLGFRFF